MASGGGGGKNDTTNTSVDTEATEDNTVQEPEQKDTAGTSNKRKKIVIPRQTTQVNVNPASDSETNSDTEADEEAVKNKQRMTSRQRARLRKEEKARHEEEWGDRLGAAFPATAIASAGREEPTSARKRARREEVCMTT